MSANKELDPFVVLRLPRPAGWPAIAAIKTISRKDVESAYRKRALACHPDRNPGDPAAKAKFERLGRAKESLLRQLESGQCEADDVQPSTGAASCSSSARSAPPVRTPDQRKREERAAADRAAAAERLKKREAAAAAAKRKAKKQEAEFQKRREQLIAEEVAQERLQAAQQRRAAVFNSWFETQRNKRARTAKQESPESGQASKKQQPPQRTEPSNGNEQEHSHAASRCHAASRMPMHSAATSSCVQPETSGGQRANATSSNLPGQMGSSDATNLPSKQKVALQRLAERRRNGEGPVVQTQIGSWWVRDEAADRYTRYLEQCGF